MAVPRQESWSGLPSPPGDLPHLWIEPACIASLSFTSEPQKPFTQKNQMKDTSVPIEQVGEKQAQLLDKLHLQEIYEMKTKKQDTSRKIYLTTLRTYVWKPHMGKIKNEVTQSCPTLWDPMDCSLPGSSVHGIF